jgi:hypothetical protein
MEILLSTRADIVPIQNEFESIMREVIHVMSTINAKCADFKAAPSKGDIQRALSDAVSEFNFTPTIVHFVKSQLVQFLGELLLRKALL